jgi:moderate conductance mechanosensitive channel
VDRRLKILKSVLCLAMVLIGLCTAEQALAQAVPAIPKAAPSNTDQVREAWEAFRSWSFADFLTWLRLHGLLVVIIIVLTFVVLWVANRLHGRLVALWMRYGDRGTRVEQENRARTLVGVLHNAFRTTVIAVATIMVLEEIGVPIGPLVGGVAVVGLAVAFGAQSLIKDYFTGFLILLEQQYIIGDVIKIGAITGQVEQITLRLTILRDFDGSVHFIPHGQINLVSNLTHGWSQAVFDLVAPASESVERIKSIFLETAADLRGDSVYGPMILADPVMAGVDSLGDATFTIKFYLRTLPAKRWEVRRELLRRIKDKVQQANVKLTIPA